MGRNGKRTTLALAITFMLLLFLAGITVARYMKEESQSGAVEAQVLYFVSDPLNEDEDLAVYFIDPVVEPSTTQFCNFVDSQRVTSTGITYGVSVTGSTVNGDTVVISGTMNTGEKTLVPLVVTPTTKPRNSGGPLELEEVKVVAESESSYKETPTGVFRGQLGNRCVVEDEAGRITTVLIMIYGDGEKDMGVTLPSGVIPDETDTCVKDYKDGQCMSRSPGYGIYSLVLLKSEDDIIMSGQGSFVNATDLNRTDG